MCCSNTVTAILQAAQTEIFVTQQNGNTRIFTHFQLLLVPSFWLKLLCVLRAYDCIKSWEGGAEILQLKVGMISVRSFIFHFLKQLEVSSWTQVKAHPVKVKTFLLKLFLDPGFFIYIYVLNSTRAVIHWDKGK